jgi:hypothetical protein
MLVRELLGKFAKKLESILESSSSYKKRSWIPSGKTTSRWKPGQSPVLKSSVVFSTKSPVRTFKVSKVSEDYFDSDIPKKVGYDLLENKEVKSTNNLDGLLVISRVSFDQRAEKETLKYFAGADENVNLASSGKQYTNDDNMKNMKYAYFTPATMYLGSAVTNDLSKGLEVPPAQVQSAVADVTKFKFSKNSPQLPLMSFQASPVSQLSYSEQNSKASGEFIAEQKGMTLASISDEFVSKYVAEEKPAMVVESTSAKSLLGSNTLIETDNPAELLKSKGGAITSPTINVNNNNLLGAVLADYQKSGLKTTVSVSPKEQEAKTATVTNKAGTPLVYFAEEFNLGAQSNALNKIGMGVADIKELPNQVKSLFVGSISPEKVSFVWDSSQGASFDKNKFDLSYNLIYQIDVLDGYEYNEGQTGKSFLKSPVWKKLTSDTYNKFVGTNVLCRASTYTNKEMSIENPKGFDLGVFNQYFLLSPESKIADFVKTDKPVPTFDKIVEKLFNEAAKEPLGVTAVTTFDKATKQPGLAMVPPKLEIKPEVAVVFGAPPKPEIKPEVAVVFGAPPKPEIKPEVAVVFGGVKV